MRKNNPLIKTLIYFNSSKNINIKINPINLSLSYLYININDNIELVIHPKSNPKRIIKLEMLLTSSWRIL